MGTQTIMLCTYNKTLTHSNTKNLHERDIK